MSPKPKQITKQYHKCPSVRHLTLFSAYGNIHPDLFAKFPEYLYNATRIRSVAIDFRFFAFSKDNNNTYAAAPTHEAFVRMVPRLDTLLGVQGEYKPGAMERVVLRDGIGQVRGYRDRGERKAGSRIAGEVWEWTAQEQWMVGVKPDAEEEMKNRRRNYLVPFIRNRKAQIAVETEQEPELTAERAKMA